MAYVRKLSIAAWIIVRKVAFTASPFLLGILILAACRPATAATPEMQAPESQISQAQVDGKAATPEAGMTIEIQKVALHPELTTAPAGNPSQPTRTPDADPARTPTPDLRPEPHKWPLWPVVPAVSAHAKDIYARGLEMGNDPHSFSIIGDCQSEPPVLLGIYDSERYYFNDGYTYLQETVDWYQGDFDRLHATVKNGLSVSSVFSPLWAPPEICLVGETPLECEFRLHKPSVVFINLGTNWKGGDGVAHGERMRELIDYVIERGILPVLSTKADNHEGDHSINLSIAELAYEYDLPLWNFWAAVQSLPHHGINPDRTDPNYLSIEAWDVHSFTALQVLDYVRRSVNGLDIPY